MGDPFDELRIVEILTALPDEWLVRRDYKDTPR
jgi:hypothetical protein